MLPKYHVGTREIPVPEALPEKLNKCVCVCVCVCVCARAHVHAQSCSTLQPHGL